MSDLIPPLGKSLAFALAVTTTAPAGVTQASVEPQESYHAALPLAESLRHTVTTGPSTELTVRIPASMIGGIGGYTVGLLTAQGLTTPPVQAAEVIPQGETAVLSMTIPYSQWNVAGAGSGAALPTVVLTADGKSYVPTMIGMFTPEPAPPPALPDLSRVEPMSPGELEVPPGVLQELRDAKRVLVVSHTPPDGDTAGSGLGLRRLLSSLGKEADLLLDGDIPGFIRHQAAPGEFSSYEDVASKEYDLVVVVDVAQAHRIGRAASILQRAPAVVILDHHGVDPTCESLGLVEGAHLSTWVAPADATAVLVSAVAERLGGLSPWVAGPLLTGMLTDTHRLGTVRFPETKPIFKHVLGEADLAGVCAGVESQLPQEARGLLTEPVRLRGELLTPEGEPVLEQALSGRGAYHEERLPGLNLMIVPRAAQELATAGGALADRETNMADIQDELFARLDGFSGPLNVMLWEQPDYVAVAIRSQDPAVAPRLAETLGGGGKPGEAGAQPRKTLAEVAEIVRGWAAS